MPLNIKSVEVERLVAEIAQRTGESKTEAVRRALEERQQRLGQSSAEMDRGKRMRRFLQQEVWPLIPPGRRRRLSRAQLDKLLGYGADGV
jgi:antitoxin VapB